MSNTLANHYNAIATFQGGAYYKTRLEANTEAEALVKLQEKLSKYFGENILQKANLQITKAQNETRNKIQFSN